MNVYFYFWCIILVPLFVVYFNTTLIVIDFGYCSDLQVKVIYRTLDMMKSLL